MLTDAKLRWALRGTAPLLVGPWLSELGFEVLYWLPFLRFLRDTYKIPPDRFIPVTRGGAAVWYEGHQESIELYDYLPIKDIRLAMLERHQKTDSIKQNAMTEMEAALMALIAKRLGLRRYRVLHPSLLFQHFKLWWSARMSLFNCVDQLHYAALPQIMAPPDLELPAEYVAVKFYSRPTWQVSEDTKHWIEDLIGRLQPRCPVILLNTGLPADDHIDVDMPGVKSLVGKVTPQNNLAIQGAVLSKAKAFVGTYGGTMQLAVCLGVPAAGFYTHFKDTAYSHKLLTEYLGMVTQKPVFIGRPADASFVQQVTG